MKKQKGVTTILVSLALIIFIIVGAVFFGMKTPQCSSAIKIQENVVTLQDQCGQHE